jgi:hypothetical protein
MRKYPGATVGREWIGLCGWINRDALCCGAPTYSFAILSRCQGAADTVEQREKQMRAHGTVLQHNMLALC